MLECRKANEVLVIRILADLVNKFPISISHAELNDHGAQHHTAWLGDISRS